MVGLSKVGSFVVGLAPSGAGDGIGSGVAIPTTVGDGEKVGTSSSTITGDVVGVAVLFELFGAGAVVVVGLETTDGRNDGRLVGSGTSSPLQTDVKSA
jgi:hypothetical protein